LEEKRRDRTNQEYFQDRRDNFNDSYSRLNNKYNYVYTMPTIGLQLD